MAIDTDRGFCSNSAHSSLPITAARGTGCRLFGVFTAFQRVATILCSFTEAKTRRTKTMQAVNTVHTATVKETRIWHGYLLSHCHLQRHLYHSRTSEEPHRSTANTHSVSSKASFSRNAVTLADHLISRNIHKVHRRTNIGPKDWTSSRKQKDVRTMISSPKINHDNRQYRDTCSLLGNINITAHLRVDGVHPVAL
jgi:hypothetical protein